jgi:hypothetical protein
MTTTNWRRTGGTLAAAALLVTWAASLAHARPEAELQEALRQLEPEMRQAAVVQNAPRWGDGRVRPAAIPDVIGPGAVLTVGNVYMKITNFGLLGNAFPALSSDPSAQWPGSSGIEYLAFGLFAVAGVNPAATDPNAKRRASYFPEWRPPTLDPEDRMYRAYDGIVNGARYMNDDAPEFDTEGRSLIDEDFLDGHDNDGDGKIDEDYAALGQQMYSCVMRDDTPAAINSVANEKHVPLGLEARQLAWAYSVPGFQDFDAVEVTIFNRSGHTLDSLYFGWRFDLDCGPAQVSSYWSDDYDLPFFPAGDFKLAHKVGEKSFQTTTRYSRRPPEADTLCGNARVPGLTDVIPIKVLGFSVADNNNDEGRTQGVPHVLLLGHTVDPLGEMAPPKVGMRAFRTHIAGTPYTDGGNPLIDQQRFEFLAGRGGGDVGPDPHEHIDPETGAITATPGDQAGDYQAWFSVGPFLNVPNGGSFQVTIALGIQRGDFRTIQQFPVDYQRFQNGSMTGRELFEKYPVMENAHTAQVAYEGVYDVPPPGFEDRVPQGDICNTPSWPFGCHGAETGLKLPKGSPPETIVEICPERGEKGSVSKTVTEFAYTWFDFDCNFCTGAWVEGTNQGWFKRHWNAAAPPPNPNLNTSSTFNYNGNPERTPGVIPAGDNTVVLAWDNLSEVTPDPKPPNPFDFRFYRIWKVAGWQRPVGSAGPNDDDWSLMGEFRLFDHLDSNYTRDPVGDTLVCPRVFIPSYQYPPSPQYPNGRRDTATVKICLRKGDLWDRQTGVILRPNDVPCLKDRSGKCVQDSGVSLRDLRREFRTRYPVGRYTWVDHQVKNGFIYFYSVTAGDSTGPTEGEQLHGRRAAVEAEGVVPQAGAGAGRAAWVVPNPYRGYKNIQSRSSSWDLTPNASDPTGTHIDFMGLPAGRWTIRIFTVAGDLVAEIHEDDPVNDSVRGPVTGSDDVQRPGFNRQQDNANDGQARWNLISRNGQDIVSGIYLFVVDSQEGQQRGKFVVIR